MKYLNKYEVKITTSGKTEFLKSKVNILDQNETWIVLKTPHYEKIAKSKTWEFAYNILNKPRIYSNTNDKVLENGIFYTLYTTKTKRSSTIKNQIDKYIHDKYSYLKNVDLSFIK